MADLYSNFLNAVDAVATKVVSEVNYNKTLLCTIVEVQEDRYIVTDSSTKFEAFSSTEDVYGVGEVVYVLIPNGDNEEKKWIIKSVGSGDNDGYEEVDPEGAFEDIKFAYENSKKYSLLANGASENMIIYNSGEMVDTKETYFICLAADFSVSVPKAAEGNYGLRLTINTLGKEGPQTFELDSSLMTGDIYSQNHTQAIFDTSDLSHFIGYKIEFYQKKNFIYSNGNEVNYKGINNSEYSNIKVSNIKFYMGESSSVVDEFSKIHFSQMRQNSGVIIGKKQNAAGMYGYDDKKLIASIGPYGKSILGASDNGSIEAFGNATIIQRNFDFDLINSEKEKIIYTDNEDVKFNQVAFGSETFAMSRENFENNVFRSYFDTIDENGGGPISTKKIVYYINSNGNDGNDGLSPATPFLSLMPVKRLCHNGLKNFVVIFLNSGGKYSLDFLENAVGINCELRANGIVNLTVGQDLIIYNSDLFFNGDFNISSGNSFKVRLGSLKADGATFNITTQIEGSSINLQESKVLNLNVINSEGSLDSVIVKKVIVLNSEIDFNQCIVDAKETTPFLLTNSTIVFDGITVQADRGLNFMSSLINLYGGKITLLGEPISGLDNGVCKNFIYNSGGIVVAQKETMDKWKELFGDNMYTCITLNDGTKEAEDFSDVSGDFQEQWEQAGKPKITREGGINNGPSGYETYYNLPMWGCIDLMRELGYGPDKYNYWERADGCKMFGDYIMVAADLAIRPKGTILPCSLGMAMVCDTGSFVNRQDGRDGHHQLDIAVNW